MNPSEVQLEQEIVRNWPVSSWSSVLVVVGVSGGPDSVALLRALVRLRATDAAGELIVAHFNHRLREGESDEDQQFVRQLAGQLGLPYHSNAPGEPARECNPTEESCRNERLDFFTQLACRVGARFVATGHSFDDQVETVLFRILRGTGLRGLAGIRPFRPLCQGVTLARPMLTLPRQVILQYLRQIGQAYRTDSSNASLHHDRNWIRNDLLPRIRSEFRPTVDDALFRLARIAEDHNLLVDSLVDALLPTARVHQKAGTIELDCRQLKTHSEAMLAELLRRLWRQSGWSMQSMSFESWNCLALAIKADHPQACALLPSKVRARRCGNKLILSRIQ